MEFTLPMLVENALIFDEGFCRVLLFAVFFVIFSFFVFFVRNRNFSHEKYLFTKKKQTKLTACLTRVA